MDKEKELEKAAKKAEKMEKTVEGEKAEVVKAGSKVPTTKAAKKEKTPKQKKIAGVVTLVIGAAVMIAGLVFMLVNLFAEPGLRDAEYLVEVGTWVREDEPDVIWNFTEVGKGELTVNGGGQNYDFLWSIDGEQMIVETDWLYTLDDTYGYEIDQNARTLTLTNGDEYGLAVYTFVPVEAEK